MICARCNRPVEKFHFQDGSWEWCHVDDLRNCDLIVLNVEDDSTPTPPDAQGQDAEPTTQAD